MFTGYTWHVSGNAYENVRRFRWSNRYPLTPFGPHTSTRISFFQIKIGENLVYGAHRLPNYMTREFASEQLCKNDLIVIRDLSVYYEGLSRIHCFCDPAEATVSGHVPSPPGLFLLRSMNHAYNTFDVLYRTIFSNFSRKISLWIIDFQISADHKCIDYHEFNETTQQCEC